MRITVKKYHNPETWDELLKKHNGSVFMTSAWLHAVSSATREPLLLSFVQNEQVVALIGGLEVKIGKGPEKQLFFYAGISSWQGEKELPGMCKNALLDYAVKNGYIRVIIKSYDFINYIPAGPGRFREFARMEYYMDLNKENESIIKGFDPEIRRRARKAAREGVIFKSTYSKKVLDKLFDLLTSTREIRKSKGYGSYMPLGIPFSDKGVLESLLKKKKARLFYAGYKNEILGVQLFLDSIGRAYGTLMGISKNGYLKSVPSFLLYEGTLSLKKEGYSCYNLGAIPAGKGNKGLKKCKDSLGAEIIVSKEESTDFLSPSLYYLNPLMRFKRFLHKVRIPWRVKKIFLNVADLLLRGRDQY